MTNKQTIDGVSREQQHIKGMVEAAGGEYAVMIDPENGHFGWTFKRCPNGQWVSGRKATDAEMHAAHQYAKSTYQSGGNDYRNELLSIAQSLREYSGNPHHIDPMSDAFKKLIMNASEALSKAAQPQGEVERLRYKSELYDEVWELATGLGYMNVTTAIGTLRAQLADRDALLREIAGLDPRGEFLGWQLDGKIDAILSTSAEPKPWGEAVAVMYADGSVLTKAECGDSFEVCCKVETPLYTEPSHSGDANEMVAKVVLPERYSLAMFQMISGFESVTPEQFDLVWSACRAEAARLNGVKP